MTMKPFDKRPASSKPALTKPTFAKEESDVSTAQLIFGRNTLEHWLQQDPKRVTKLWLAEGLLQDKRVAALLRLAKTANIPVSQVPRIKLDGMLTGYLKEMAAEEEAEEPSGTASSGKNAVEKESGYRPSHQGIAGQLATKPLLSLQELLASLPNPLPAKGLLLMLDGVTDTHNLGAILRVADAAGAWGVLIGKHRSATLGPQVAKTSCGADACVPVAQVGNLRQALETLKTAGFWSVATVCAPLEKGKVAHYRALDYKMPTVLLLGSEGKGLSPQLQKASDFLITIPLHGTLNSLNVSTAAAVLAMTIQEAQLV
jgi:23S rRNA (guanosine2251-2'-O)-methyltransferase